ncbi:hypothetical protein ACFSYS_06005 [Christiangramia antarctica]|uniref:Uncharacterized protein n=1 Tax=Christiangramia antarctica TaxID=2058158 RepID=A0ABW5X175_9FLAO
MLKKVLKRPEKKLKKALRKSGKKLMKNFTIPMM